MCRSIEKPTIIYTLGYNWITRINTISIFWVIHSIWLDIVCLGLPQCCRLLLFFAYWFLIGAHGCANCNCQSHSGRERGEVFPSDEHYSAGIVPYRLWWIMYFLCLLVIQPMYKRGIQDRPIMGSSSSQHSNPWTTHTHTHTLVMLVQVTE